MSHSKRNTSRAVFTSHEREQAKRAWGATSARLTRESMLAFGACGLCLEPARDPVACARGGDVFCRECALSNILAQRREIRRVARARDAGDREQAEAEGRRDAEARDREVAEFERVLSGIGGSSTASEVRAIRGGGSGIAVGGDGGADTNTSSTRGKNAADASSAPPSEAGARSAKRKFEMDEDELARIAADDRAKARRALDDEKSSKPKLPSFWTPSITPTSNSKDALHEVVKKDKATPVCPASPADSPHAYSLATLVAVNFTEEEDDKTHARQRVCPSCKKVLSNASKAMLAKPCGHVVCGSCVDRFMRPTGHHDPHADAADAAGLRCYVCDADLVHRPSGEKDKDKGDKGKKKDKDKEKITPGLVEIRSEGTGFSAGGVNQVQKIGVAFQC